MAGFLSPNKPKSFSLKYPPTLFCIPSFLHTFRSKIIFPLSLPLALFSFDSANSSPCFLNSLLHYLLNYLLHYLNYLLPYLLDSLLPSFFPFHSIVSLFLTSSIPYFITSSTTYILTSSIPYFLPFSLFIQSFLSSLPPFPLKLLPLFLTRILIF